MCFSQLLDIPIKRQLTVARLAHFGYEIIYIRQVLTFGIIFIFINNRHNCRCNNGSFTVRPYPFSVCVLRDKCRSYIPNRIRSLFAISPVLTCSMTGLRKLYRELFSGFFKIESPHFISQSFKKRICVLIQFTFGIAAYNILAR